jgi:hypothetical protein
MFDQKEPAMTQTSKEERDRLRRIGIPDSPVARAVADADRCAELEAEVEDLNSVFKHLESKDYNRSMRLLELESRVTLLQAVVDAARYWREYSTIPNAANLCGALDALDAHDKNAP